MNAINFNSAKLFLETIPSTIGAYGTHIVSVITANPTIIAAAIVAIAAVVIGVKCYRAYTALKLEVTKLKSESQFHADEASRIQQLCNAQDLKYKEPAKTISELESKKEYLEKLLSEKTLETSKLKKQNEQSSRDIVDSREEIKTLTVQLEAAKLSYTELISHQGDLYSKELTSLDVKISDLKNELKELTNKNVKLSEENKRLNARVKSLTPSLSIFLCK
jgi:chromosome segregation ATPase